MTKSVKAWAVVDKDDDLVFWSGSALVYKTKQRACDECAPEEGERVVRVTIIVEES